MAYDIRALERARERFDKEKQRRRLEHEARTEAVYNKIPRLYEISREQRTLGLRLTDAFLLGEKADMSEGQIRKMAGALAAERERLLLQNGYPADYLSEKSVCALCADTGVKGNDACDCLLLLYRDEELKSLSRLLGINPGLPREFEPEGYSAAPGGGPSDREIVLSAYKFLYDYAQGFGPDSPSLYFRGEGGVDKLFFPAFLARELVGRDVWVVYTTEFSLTANFEGARYGRNESAEEELDRAARSDFLIIDRLGAESISAYGVSALMDLLDDRAAARRATAILSELDIPELAARYSSELASRVSRQYKRIYIPKKAPRG